MRASWTVKKIPKYTKFNGADPMRKKKLNTDHTDIMISAMTTTLSLAVDHTQHEKAKCIVVPNCVRTAIGLSYPKEGSRDDSEAKVE